jgi:isocitrate dehydrogenase kinase/phosphatase
MKHHADLLSPAYWQARKERIMSGYLEDVFPYPQACRFQQHQQAQQAQQLLTTPAAEAA